MLTTARPTAPARDLEPHVRDVPAGDPSPLRDVLAGDPSPLRGVPAGDPSPLRGVPAGDPSPLRLVTDAEVVDVRRQARTRRLAAVAVALVIFGVFAVVTAHVTLMQGQFELETLQERSASAQADYDRLRLQVSELESPDRIVAAAQEKLGMVTPARITYLAPPAELGPIADLGADGEVTAPSSSSATSGPGRWSSVKSHLAEG